MPEISAENRTTHLQTVRKKISIFFQNCSIHEGLNVLQSFWQKVVLLKLILKHVSNNFSPFCYENFIIIVCENIRKNIEENLSLKILLIVYFHHVFEIFYIYSYISQLKIKIF
jgi:hypothetical protein